MRILMMLLLGVAVRCYAFEHINLHYYERPPFMETSESGEVQGLIADRARRAFIKAGIPFRWVLTPVKRQLLTIAANRDADCGVGWFKTEDREKFAEFSIPVYKDLPTAVIFNRNLGIKPGATVNDAFREGVSNVLLKDGLVFSNYIVDVISKYKLHIVTTAMDQMHMIRMIAANRADVMFTSQEELEYLISGSEVDRDSISIRTFTDLPLREKRYIMCSKMVSKETMNALNKALSSLNDGHP